MTAQTGDKFLYDGDNYSIVAFSVPLKFDPKTYGFTPKPFSTGLWDGYWCNYTISDKGIFLDKLFINCKNDEYPLLNGKKFSVDDEGKPIEYMGYRVYNDLNIKLEYTGRILVGDEFIQDYYIHMGYQQAYGYKVLKEFVFRNGELIEANDRSKEAAVFRKIAERYDEILVKNNMYDKKRKNDNNFVEKCYSLDYKDKCWWLP